MAQNQADGANRGGIRLSTPTYFFWMKFFEKQPELKSEFHSRVVNGDGFLNWDFLPQQGKIARLSKGAQYRRALGCVREAIDAFSSGYLANVDASYLVERIGYLTSLGDLTDQILTKRRNNIYTHDTLASRVVESYSQKKPTQRHKEVYEIWREIRSAITRSKEVLTNELEHRERPSLGVQQAVRPPAVVHQQGPPAVVQQAVRPQVVVQRSVRPQRQAARRDAEEDEDCCVIL